MNSKFFAAFKGLSIVPTGTKASNDVTPTLTLLGIPNKFQLNRLATAMLGLEIGKRVRLFRNKFAESTSEMYFIAVTADTDETGAKISKANSGNAAKTGVDMTFNYSGVWSILIQNDCKAVELGYDALVEKGVVIKDETTGGNVRYRSAVNVKLELEEAGECEIDDVTYNMFALVNYKSSQKSPDETSDDDDDASAATIED